MDYASLSSPSLHSPGYSQIQRGLFRHVKRATQRQWATRAGLLSGLLSGLLRHLIAFGLLRNPACPPPPPHATAFAQWAGAGLQLKDRNFEWFVKTLGVFSCPGLALYDFGVQFPRHA